MKSAVFRPGRNVWRIERARRAAVLIDGAAFFGAVRAACLKARRRILMTGWDIDSRTRLIGENDHPADGYPAGFVEFLTALVEQKPELRIDLLLWDYSVLYATEREPMPRLSLQWSTPERINLCLDNAVPFGSSQHQKVIVVDDAVAFSGGLDITIRRWDTSRHEFDNKLRVDPAGKPYPPFHDVQMVVDGQAAHALAELAHTRWCRARGEEPPIEPLGDPWPEIVEPQFTDVDVAIARTQPPCDGAPEVREVEALFLDSIDHAQRSIYIENQFLTDMRVAKHLARRLRAKPELEVVMVAPHIHHTWLEQRTMRNGRIRFWREVSRAGGERVRLLYPSVEQGRNTTDTMIHSKIMVIDDEFLRVGSANINNRSMGADTECDLVVHAANEEQGAAIVRLRNQLLGEHCGVGPDEVAAELAKHGSLVRAADALAAGGHRLLPIDDGKPDRNVLAFVIEQIADPRSPVNLPRIFGRLARRIANTSNRTGWTMFGVALLALALTLAWQLTDLSEVAEPERIRALLAEHTRGPWAPLLVLGAFLLGAAMFFPVTIMILATAATFGPLLGIAYSLIGVTASAAVTYWIGRRFGQQAVSRLLGERWHRIRDRLGKRGVLTVVAVRVVPSLPFTLINLALGASAIRPIDFVVGTVIGMAPGLIAISLLGDRIVNVIADPTLREVGLFALCLAGWIAVSIAAQALVTRLGARTA
ncbi:MAG TPA: VTT domain-containing protein [Reyranellaceae bacterium]|nr:VTT domain-containing protein [Reyranellaceae bacterium]